MTDNNYINQNQINEEESAISLTDIWRMIWDYKWWYVLSTFLCLVAVCFYIYKTPNVYERNAKIIIDESEQSSTMRNLTQMTGAMTGLRANSQVANEMQALSSPDLMQQVVERLRLETKYYEHQFLRNVEYYQNNPIELKLVEANPHTSFAFTVVRKDSSNVILRDFVIGPDKVRGHGGETFVQGIQNSCNPVFINVGLRVGSDDFYEGMNALGMLSKTGIDIPGEAG